MKPERRGGRRNFWTAEDDMTLMHDFDRLSLADLCRKWGAVQAPSARAAASWASPRAKAAPQGAASSVVRGGAMIPVRAYIAAGLVAALLALAGWWHLSRVRAAERAVHAHYAVVLAEISAKTAKAETEFRATGTAWRDAFDKEARDGREKIAAAHADADAYAAGERMRAAPHVIAPPPTTAGASL